MVITVAKCFKIKYNLIFPNLNIKNFMNINQKVKWFQENYPELCQKLNESSHHYDYQNISPYHICGSIWTHSMMVSKMAEILNGDNILQWSALLHDIGKPFCEVFDHDKKKVRNHNHENYSTILAVEILNKSRINNQDKAMILNVINYHTAFLDSIDNDGNFKKSLIESFSKDLMLYEYIKRFSVFDILGRFCEESKRNDTALKYIENNSDSNYVPKFDNDFKVRYDKTVTIMIGLPCSGKSTYINSHHEDDIKISRDDIIVEFGEKLGLNYNESFNHFNGKKSSIINDELQYRINDAKKSDANIVIDMTNLGSKSRLKWFKIFDNYNINAVVLLPELKTIQKRNIERSSTGKFISDDVYDDMIKRFQMPLYSEGFDNIKVIF